MPPFSQPTVASSLQGEPDLKPLLRGEGDHVGGGRMVVLPIEPFMVLFFCLPEYICIRGDKMFLLKNESKKLKIFAAITLTLFLVTCIATSLYYGNELLLGSIEKMNNDDVKYLRSANTLINTGKLTYKNPDKSTVFIMPGIVFVLAPFVKIFGMVAAITPFRIFSAILQTATLYMIFLLARKMFNNKVAVVALILSAIYIPNIYMTSLLLTETVFLFLFMLLCLIVVHGLEKKELKYYIVGGIVWGLAALFRPSIGLFPLVILGMWLIKKYTLKEMLKFGLAASITFILVMSPWWIRNALVFNRFIPFTLSTGNPMLQGMFEWNQVDEELIKQLNTDNLEYTGDEIIDNDIQVELAHKIFKYKLKENPAEYLAWHTIGKIAMNFAQGYIMKPIYGLTYPQLIFQHELYIVLAIIALILAGIYKDKNEWKWFAIFIIMYFIAVHIPFLAYSRYMYPIMPFVIILASSLVNMIPKIK